MNEQTLEALARHVGGRIEGDAAVKIASVAGLAQAQAGQITFLANPRYTKLLVDTKASAVVVSEPIKTPAAQIIVDDPYYAFTQIAVLLHGHRPHHFTGVSKRASIDPSAAVGNGTRVHDFVTVSANARVGQRCVLYPGVFIGDGAVVGDDCIFYPNVSIADNVRVGHRVIIQAGTSVGGDGFGFATHKGEHHKIPHIGRVVLEDDVALGANCSVQSGALYNTVVGRGTKVGDLVVIGHAVQVGPGCLIVTQAGIAGSTTLGHHCVIAGQVGIAGHLKLGNLVTVAAQSGVTNDLDDGAKVFGSPAYDMKEAVKAYTSIKVLPEMRKLLRELERRVEELEGKGRAA